jgi:hypothetical protein
MATVLRVALILAAAYVVIVAVAYVFQDRLALPGPGSPPLNGDAIRAPNAQVVTVMTADGVALAGLLLPAAAASGPSPGLLWFYGNMETVYAMAEAVAWLQPPGVTVLMVDYRGYGRSPGKPSEQGLYLDAEAAWDYLAGRHDVDATRIAVYGRSIGSVPALHLANTRPVRAVALDSPFTSARDMARRHYPFVPTALIRLEMDNRTRAERLKVPLLVFHGENDRIAPAAMGREIARAGRAETLIVIPGAGHNDTYVVGGTSYRDALHQFLQRHLLARR